MQAVTKFWLHFYKIFLAHFRRCVDSIDLKLLYDAIGSLCVKRDKKWLLLNQNLLLGFGLFPAVFLPQSLSYCQVQNYG